MIDEGRIRKAAPRASGWDGGMLESILSGLHLASGATFSETINAVRVCVGTSVVSVRRSDCGVASISNGIPGRCSDAWVHCGGLCIIILSSIDIISICLHPPERTHTVCRSRSA